MKAESPGFPVSAQLPLEILPHILTHLSWRVRDLAACSLVSTQWNHFATPFLYARLFLRDQRRLKKVFSTLEGNETLSRLVRVLEIRVFPFGLRAEELERLEESILNALKLCSGLQELLWTRTGSLTDRVVPFLPPLPSLHTLELTGSSRFYSPQNITQHLLSPEKTPNLRHFSIVLPDRDVASELPSWARALGPKLESFSVLCQHSAIITDFLLSEISKHLSGLQRLSLAGCKWVTADGILPLLRSAGGKMKELAIEGLAIHPSTFVALVKYLPNLTFLSLTYPRQNLCPPSEHWPNLALFVESLPRLEEFTHYTSSWNTPRGMYSETLDSDDEDSAGGEDVDQRTRDGQRYGDHTGEGAENADSGAPYVMREPKLSHGFLKRLVLARGQTLTKLRIHGIASTKEQMREICFGCPNLRDLVLHLYEGDKEVIGDALSQLPVLSSLHLLSSLYADLYLSEEDLRHLAKIGSPELRQIGFRNRVWLVERVPISLLQPNEQVSESDRGGEESNSRWILADGRIVVLRRWDMSAGTFPEVLLVVRACKWGR